MYKTIDKPLVKKHFDNGLQTYDKHATVQQKITCKLIQLLHDLGFECFNKGFEVGCGSGFLTRKLIKDLHIDKLIVNDISCTSQELVNIISEELKKKIEFLCGDAEEIEIPQNNNAVFTTSTMQWFSELTQFFDKVYSSLEPGGLFALSTFGPNNFKEIKSLTGIGLQYPPLTKLLEMLSNKFEILAQEEWIDILEFDHLQDVLRHIKQTGVNGVKHQYFGKDRLFEFAKNYSKQFGTLQQTVTLTYHPIIIIAQKK